MVKRKTTSAIRRSRISRACALTISSSIERSLPVTAWVPVPREGRLPTDGRLSQPMCSMAASSSVTYVATVSTIYRPQRQPGGKKYVEVCCTLMCISAALSRSIRGGLCIRVSEYAILRNDRVCWIVLIAASVNTVIH